MVVEVNFLGLAEPSLLRTKPLLKRAPELDFGYSLEVAAPPGSQAVSKLRKALSL